MVAFIRFFSNVSHQLFHHAEPKKAQSKNSAGYNFKTENSHSGQYTRLFNESHQDAQPSFPRKMWNACKETGATAASCLFPTKHGVSMEDEISSESGDDTTLSEATEQRETCDGDYSDLSNSGNYVPDTLRIMMSLSGSFKELSIGGMVRPFSDLSKRSFSRSGNRDLDSWRLLAKKFVEVPANESGEFNFAITARAKHGVRINIMNERFFIKD